ncbi:unnamed protein product [Caenorhabditis angaria]|uniref:NDT80 domain-containing protein n=1 Tax=Caenorhabditis angaria TaxID=860376 RepID=A0A9P1J091_9PELO|nr:unnamed protein product [Caenorhabditis angaria]
MTRRKNVKEEGLNDPLANVEQFNIIQFLAAENEFALPLDDQLEPNNAALVAAQQMKHEVIDPQHNHPTMFQLTGRLPESPPITDISGNGSSASPSSNPDEPYSPDFHNYAGLAGGREMNGLILGANEIQANVLRSAFESRKYDNRNNQQLSPTETSACFMSPYPPSEQPTPRSFIQSVSPDGQNENRGYPLHNLYNPLNVSSDGSINSQGSDPPNRKRSRLDAGIDPTSILNAALLGHAPNAASPVESYMGDDNFAQPVIKFNKFQEETWSDLYDCHGRALQQLQVAVIADKGFNFSANDGCFVNQKKNHFQITVSVEATDAMPPALVKYKGNLMPITEFKLSFCGVKSEMTSSEICIKQSRTDRKPHPHMPVNFEIQERRMTKVTVPRLHFSETTLNNQRKNLRPNPEQKYFFLVKKLL